MTHPSDEAVTGLPESICVCSGDIWTGTWEEYGTPIYRQDRDSSRRWGQQFTEEQRDAIAAEIAARYNAFDAMREVLENIDAVGCDFGHFEAAARTMQELARKALKDIEDAS